MADRPDINERVATLENIAAVLKEEAKLAREKLHRQDNKLTAHGLDLDWMRPVVEKLERAHQRLLGVGIVASGLGGLVGALIVKLIA